MQKPVLIYQFNLGIFAHTLIFFLETDIQDQGGGLSAPSYKVNEGVVLDPKLLFRG